MSLLGLVDRIERVLLGLVARIERALSEKLRQGGDEASAISMGRIMRIKVSSVVAHTPPL
jgi:hypothetical protein